MRPSPGELRRVAGDCEADHCAVIYVCDTQACVCAQCRCRRRACSPSPQPTPACVLRSSSHCSRPRLRSPGERRRAGLRPKTISRSSSSRIHGFRPTDRESYTWYLASIVSRIGGCRRSGSRAPTEAHERECSSEKPGRQARRAGRPTERRSNSSRPMPRRPRAVRHQGRVALRPRRRSCGSFGSPTRFPVAYPTCRTEYRAACPRRPATVLPA